MFFFSFFQSAISILKIFYKLKSNLNDGNLSSFWIISVEFHEITDALYVLLLPTWSLFKRLFIQFTVEV